MVMHLFDQNRHLPSKACALFLLFLISSIPARADVVFDNLTIQPSNGPTIGTSIGASLVTGSFALQLSDIIFPQLNGTANTYVPGEAFSINTRNADGTVGLSLYTDFALANDAASGQTNAVPNTPFVLLPNTGYWFVVTATAGTAWGYTTGASYASLYGVTQPASNVAYKTTDNGLTSSYFSLADGPQLLRVDAVALAIPEPSPVWWFAAVVGSVFLRKRWSRCL